jgi:hypothetical protein
MKKTSDKAAFKVLKEAGYNPMLQEFPMGHPITEEFLAGVWDFLLPLIKSNRLVLVRFFTCLEN